MIPAESFDLTNGAVVLRLICALFFIPHMYFKAFGNPPPAIKTFIDAGYPKPLFFVKFALVVELITFTLLLLNIYTQYVALLAASMLTVAAVSVYFANGKKWLWIWVKGGKEYCVFWALCCVVVSMLYWQ
jgi:putative oxidoreductase